MAHQPDAPDSAGQRPQASAEFDMVWKPSDADLAAIRDAYLNNSEIGLAFLTDDQATVGAEGPVGDWMITGFSRSEPLEEGITISVTAKLSSFTEWHETTV